METRQRQALPEAFTEKMKELLREESEEFFESYEQDRVFGLRVNPLKAGTLFCHENSGNRQPGELLEREPFEDAPQESGLEEEMSGEKLSETTVLNSLIGRMTPVPWCREGYYYAEELRPGKHPLHEAGTYYIQEPSAMAVVEALAPVPGERILDLCAAPGGKTTHAAGRMLGKGILVSNEIHPARAKILSQNVERMGIANGIVTNMDPAGLIPYFPEFFDGILVDAPCSGEGMFRKDEEARMEWSPEHVALCAARQDGILDCAARMLKPGGRMVYSTCTFSPEENEQTVSRFLSRHPEFSLRTPAIAGFFSEGRPDWADKNPELSKTVRIWPHKTGGEGHFLALLVKGGGGSFGEGRKEQNGSGTREKEEGWNRDRQKTGRQTKDWQVKGRFQRKSRQKNSQTAAEAADILCSDVIRLPERLMEGRKPVFFGENLYLVPEEMPEMDGLRVLRPGLHAGTVKKGRVEPAHGLAMFLKAEEAAQAAEIGAGETAWKYLRGEVLTEQDLCGSSMPQKGWVLVTVDGFGAGFAKASGGVLKNHYPKGLRRS